MAIDCSSNPLLEKLNAAEDALSGAVAGLANFGSAQLAVVEAQLEAFKTALTDAIPELPVLPNFQIELAKALIDFAKNGEAGIASFIDRWTDGVPDIGGIIAKAAAGELDICKEAPNVELNPDGTFAEIAIVPKQVNEPGAEPGSKASKTKDNTTVAAGETEVTANQVTLNEEAIKEHPIIKQLYADFIIAKETIEETGDLNEDLAKEMLNRRNGLPQIKSLKGNDSLPFVNQNFSANYLDYNNFTDAEKQVANILVQRTYLKTGLKNVEKLIADITINLTKEPTSDIKETVDKYLAKKSPVYRGRNVRETGFNAFILNGWSYQDTLVQRDTSGPRATGDFVRGGGESFQNSIAATLITPDQLVGAFQELQDALIQNKAYSDNDNTIPVKPNDPAREEVEEESVQAEVEAAIPANTDTEAAQQAADAGATGEITSAVPTAAATTASSTTASTASSSASGATSSGGGGGGSGY